MKTFLIVLLVLAGAIIAGWYFMSVPEFSVEQTPKDLGGSREGATEETSSLADGTYVLVSEDSSMRWQGSRPLIQGYFDNGVITISEGIATIHNGAVTSGEVVVDMTSISARSTGRGQGETMLTRDLKSGNWFDAAQYPESRFVFRSAEDNGDGTATVAGELTIKGITASLSFPATITMRDGRLIMRAVDIGVDRTVWGVTYQSGSFFRNLGERLVADVFTLTFTAVFEPQGQ